MNLLDAAKNLIETIEESDKKYGVGDRSTEENEAIKQLKLVILRSEEVFNVTYGSF